jgi:MFS family permease
LIDSTPKQNRAAWYQFYAMIYVVAQMLFRTLGILLADALGDVFVFFLIAGLVFCCAPLVLLLNPPRFHQIQDLSPTDSIPH